MTSVETTTKKRKARTTYLTWKETGFLQDVTIQRIDALPDGFDADNHTIFYEVKGVGNQMIICYLMKGAPVPYGDPKQICTVYRNGKIRYGCETSLLEAFKKSIEKAINYTI